MKEINLDTWSRSKLFLNYLDQGFPYINIGMRLDVTELVDWCHDNEVSFYFAMVHQVTKVANSIENFKYRFKDKKVFLIDENVPVLTHMKKGEDVFYSVISPYIDDILEYCRKTRRLADEASHDTLSKINKRQDIINISCIPWIDYTHFVRTMVNFGQDCNPKISWGKYVKGNDGRVTMNFSVQVHHGLMDGFHVAKFMNGLQDQLSKF